MAATAQPTRTTGRLTWSLVDAAGRAATSPANTSSESPGRKKPTSRPVSAKTMANRPARPKASRRCLASTAGDASAAQMRLDLFDIGAEVCPP